MRVIVAAVGGELNAGSRLGGVAGEGHEAHGQLLRALDAAVGPARDHRELLFPRRRADRYHEAAPGRQLLEQGPAAAVTMMPSNGAASGQPP